jgi:hypothetical protein
METLKWSDEDGPRSRAAWLLLVRADEVRAFGGTAIPGWCAVTGSDYTKNGTWSHTTFRLVLAPGVRAIPLRAGWETGRFVEGLAAAVGGDPVDRWADVARALGVSVEAAQSFLRDWGPKAAERLDAVEADLAALEETR